MSMTLRSLTMRDELTAKLKAAPVAVSAVGGLSHGTFQRPPMHQNPKILLFADSGSMLYHVKLRAIRARRGDARAV